MFQGLLAERRPNTEDPRVQQCLLDCPVLRDALDDVQGLTHTYSRGTRRCPF